MKHVKSIRRLLAFLLSAVIALAAAGCGTGAGEPADDISSSDPEPVQWVSDPDFEDRVAGFSIELFKKSFDDVKNTLVSPLSVLLALAITANGAEGETLEQMEQVLGGLPIAGLNAKLRDYVRSLPSTEKAKLHIANSIWFRDDPGLKVQPEFLWTNANFYGAAVRRSPFDGRTVGDINNWVKDNTDGMIKEIVDEIDPAVVLYLINAMVFDAEWERVYEENQIRQGNFYAAGRLLPQRVDFMHQQEHSYLSDDKAVGFLRPYAGGRYAFAALLPDEGVPLEEYIAGLDGERLAALLANARPETVYAAIPKFSFECETSLKESLIGMGMPLAFGAAADFSAMSADTPLCISAVRHKTFIEVNERGARAAAVTAVETAPTSAMPGKYVTLDRPFVFAIIDGDNGLPLFIGAVNTVEN
ncbi:MAG: serpin family protein [Oscillospiraceae bacterium]|nr:serpin family protein [Oscillospiraceae bacterium]